MKKKSEKPNGFTLIELLIVITMLAIVITVGAPSFSGFIEEGRARSGARAVATALQTARLQAINSNRRCFIDFAPGSLTPADSFFTIWLDMDGDLALDSGEIDSTGLNLSETRGSYKGYRLPQGVSFGTGSVSPPTAGPDASPVPGDGVDFGASDMVSFNGRGEANSSGSVFIAGENGSTYAVTMTGLGAVRTFRWEDNQWK